MKKICIQPMWMVWFMSLNFLCRNAELASGKHAFRHSPAMRDTCVVRTIVPSRFLNWPCETRWLHAGPHFPCIFIRIQERMKIIDQLNKSERRKIIDPIQHLSLSNILLVVGRQLESWRRTHYGHKGWPKIKVSS